MKAQAWTAEAENTGCVFCASRDDQSVILRNELSFAIRDTTPVTAMHTLVLPYRHAETYFDLAEPELAAANDLLRRLRSEILDADPLVRGFNVGANVGVASGQSIFHCHIHLIPRRDGDVPKPLGGVRRSHPRENARLRARQRATPPPLTIGRARASLIDGDGVRLLTALGADDSCRASFGRRSIAP